MARTFLDFPDFLQAIEAKVDAARTDSKSEGGGAEQGGQSLAASIPACRQFKNSHMGEEITPERQAEINADWACIAKTINTNVARVLAFDIPTTDEA